MEGPINFTVLPRLARKTPTRILFLVMDGLGGCLGKEPTALQASKHPNLDALAARSALGRTIQVLDGITPGSGSVNFTDDGILWSDGNTSLGFDVPLFVDAAPTSPVAQAIILASPRAIAFSSTAITSTT